MNLKCTVCGEVLHSIEEVREHFKKCQNSKESYKDAEFRSVS